MRLTFGDVTIDCGRRQLTRGGNEVRISAKAFAFLELLLQRRPNAVTRADIFDHVWPKTFVSPSNVATLAQEIREALGDDARRPRFLRTIFGYGYAFIGEEEQPSVATTPLRLIAGVTQVELPQGETILGRRLPLLAADHSISRDHARIVVDGDRATIEDLGSKNGTFVGGRPVQSPTELLNGDEIAIGAARLIFRSSTEAESTITAIRAGIARH
jgi:DNA-binding winged helix-turn-helix (wHTH) protein